MLAQGVSILSLEHWATAKSLLLFKLMSSTYNHPLQSYIDMANTWKPAANVSKQSSAGTQPTVTAHMKENIQLSSSTSTRSALASKPSGMNTSNGAKDSEMDATKDAETAMLIASLQGFFISLLSLISLYSSLLFSQD